MKLLFITFLMIAFSKFADAQPGNISIGTIDTIQSSILDEKRPIWIHVPDYATARGDHQKKYPVIYLLDGDWHFVSVVGIIQQLSYINGNTICPEMIVVGIPVKDRFRDLTPSCDSTISETSGGYHNFISFIRNELMPYIDSTYHPVPFRIFIGHSLGGLAVINTLVYFPHLFNAYVAIDPSMWWDNQSTLKTAETAFTKNEFENIRLFLAIANNMDKGMDTSKVRSDISRNTLSIRSILMLSDILNATAYNKLSVQTIYYINETHSSIPLIATYDALHFIFDFYNLPLTKSDYADTTMALAYRIENHYNIVSEKMEYRINPSESLINTLGYNAMYMNNVALSEYFFTLNVINYPNSYNAYDSMGDFYVSVNKTDQAIEMYTKALLIFENSETRMKLNNIHSKK